MHCSYSVKHFLITTWPYLMPTNQWSPRLMMMMTKLQKHIIFYTSNRIIDVLGHRSVRSFVFMPNFYFFSFPSGYNRSAWLHEGNICYYCTSCVLAYKMFFLYIPYTHLMFHDGLSVWVCSRMYLATLIMMIVSN